MWITASSHLLIYVSLLFCSIHFDKFSDIGLGLLLNCGLLCVWFVFILFTLARGTVQCIRGGLRSQESCFTLHHCLRISQVLSRGQLKHASGFGVFPLYWRPIVWLRLFTALRIGYYFLTLSPFQHFFCGRNTRNATHC